MARFAWFPCMQMGEFGTTMQAMDELWEPCMVQEAGYGLGGRSGGD